MGKYKEGKNILDRSVSKVREGKWGFVERGSRFTNRFLN